MSSHRLANAVTVKIYAHDRPPVVPIYGIQVYTRP